MTDEELQEIEDTASGKALLNDDEILEWLKNDVLRLIAEVRRLQSSLRRKDAR